MDRYCWRIDYIWFNQPVVKLPSSKCTILCGLRWILTLTFNDWWNNLLCWLKFTKTLLFSIFFSFVSSHQCQCSVFVINSVCVFLRYLYELHWPAHGADWFCWLRLFPELVQHSVRSGSLPSSNSSSAAHGQPARPGTVAVNHFSCSWDILLCTYFTHGKNWILSLPAQSVFWQFASAVLVQYSAKTDKATPGLQRLPHVQHGITGHVIWTPVVPQCTCYYSLQHQQPASAHCKYSFFAPTIPQVWQLPDDQCDLQCHHPHRLYHGAQGFVQQGHGFTYAQTPCHSLGYPANMSDPIQAALPSVAPAHCFSVPKQVAVPGVRGKHKKKTGGARTDSPSAAPSGSQFIAPKPPSCLAQLLSGTRERKSALSTILSLTSVIS